MRVVRDRAVIGDEVAHAGRRDQKLSQHHADESGGDAQAQAREDHRRSVGDHDLEDALHPRALKRAAHGDERRAHMAHGLVGVEHDHRQR